MIDWNKRYIENSGKRADKYVSWMKEYTELKDKLILELGCGAGYFADKLSEDNVVVASDITCRVPNIRNYQFIKFDATKIPFKDNSFDIVYSSDVYEHVQDQDAFLSESFRVSKNLVFFNTGNRWFPVDRHTGIPFMDLLPRKTADYLAKRFTKRTQYDVEQPSFWSLRKKVQQFTDDYEVKYIFSRLFTPKLSVIMRKKVNEC